MNADDERQQQQAMDERIAWCLALAEAYSDGDGTAFHALLTDRNPNEVLLDLTSVIVALIVDLSYERRQTKDEWIAEIRAGIAERAVA